jgi:hypothetical protein
MLVISTVVALLLRKQRPHISALGSPHSPRVLESQKQPFMPTKLEVVVWRVRSEGVMSVGPHTSYVPYAVESTDNCERKCASSAG